MNQLSATMRMADITVADGMEPDTGTVSLESRALKAYAESTVSANRSRNDVMTRLELPGLTSPEELHAIQEKVADYSLKVSLISTVSRKATAAVESLLRS